MALSLAKLVPSRILFKIFCSSKCTNFWYAWCMRTSFWILVAYMPSNFRRRSFLPRRPRTYRLIVMAAPRSLFFWFARHRAFALRQKHCMIIAAARSCRFFAANSFALKMRIRHCIITVAFRFLRALNIRKCAWIRRALCSSIRFRCT